MGTGFGAVPAADPSQVISHLAGNVREWHSAMPALMMKIRSEAMRASQRLPLIPIFVLLVPLAAQSPMPAFSLSIAAEPQTIKPGAEVTLFIGLTNNTQRQLSFPMMDRYQAESNFTIHVTDPTGEPAGKTRFYRMMTGDKTGKDAVEPPYDPRHEVISVGSLDSWAVPPGKTVEGKAVLNKLFDMSKPGKYTIQVEKIDDLSKAVVKSNIVTITVAN
jgi:hypothetical protein